MKFHYDVPGNDFSLAGHASTEIKKVLVKLALNPDVIRRTAIAMYEAEINMVIHAGGGAADVEVGPERIEIVMSDHGPGIEDLSLAMTEGFSTAPESVRELGFGAGMGLPNMKRNSDFLKVDSTVGVGTTVTMRIEVGGGSRA